MSRQVGYCYDIDDHYFQVMMSRFYKIRETRWWVELKWALDCGEASYIRGVADSLPDGRRLRLIADRLQQLADYMEKDYIKLDIVSNP